MKITKQVYQELIQHMKAGFPNEACGILAGPSLGEGTVFFPMRNMDESPISYFMEPKQQFLVIKEIRARNLVMTGAVHSHVASEAYPSKKDVRLAFDQEIQYLIVSLADPQKEVLRSFTIQEEQISEEDVHIV